MGLWFPSCGPSSVPLLVCPAGRQLPCCELPCGEAVGEGSGRMYLAAAGLSLSCHTRLHLAGSSIVPFENVQVETLG